MDIFQSNSIDIKFIHIYSLPFCLSIFQSRLQQLRQPQVWQLTINKLKKKVETSASCLKSTSNPHAKKLYCDPGGAGTETLTTTPMVAPTAADVPTASSSSRVVSEVGECTGVNRPEWKVDISWWPPVGGCEFEDL